jgi:type II secretion system protein N
MPPRTLTEKQRKWAYGTFFALSFLFALRQTFPYEALGERMVLEAAAQGWHLKMGDLGPNGLLGFDAEEVTLESSASDGLRISVDELAASVSILPLFIGRQKVSFDAELFEGELEGIYEDRGGATRLRLEASGIDLAKAPPVKQLTGLDLAGVLEADIDVILDDKDAKKSSGRVSLGLTRAAVNGGEVPVPAMGGGISLPKMALGTVSANATIQDGKLNVEKLEARGEDVQLSTEGLHAVMQPRLRHSTLFGKAKLKLNDAFWQKSGTAPFKSIADMALAKSKGPDGAYAFQLSGSLGSPQARPVTQ